MKTLGVIPARGGSKGLPKKNIRTLAGKPLIAWTIQQAQESDKIDKVIVSTEDGETASIARRYGADVPFMRPLELATDTAKSLDVVLHALGWFEEKGEHFDLAVLLQPTSPLRETMDIDKALEPLFLKDAQAVVSVCQAEHHPYWMNTLPADGSMVNFISPEIAKTPRQGLPPFYRLNGAIYAAYGEFIKEKKSFYGEKTFAYIMPPERSIDIDAELDFYLCECLFKRNKRV